LGTRGSALALAQTRLVLEALGGAGEIRVVRTTGDESTRPLQELGDGVFVTALEDALRAGTIDAAVHSLKDLPTGPRPGLTVAAILPREDPRDVLVTTARGGLASLVPHARVGTSSPRRDAALRAVRPDIVTGPIRGNVETRLQKVARGDHDATVLALAGMRRLGLAVGDEEILSFAVMLPAPGQGAIAVQCRADDEATRDRLGAIDHRPTRSTTDAERELLRLLGGSCDLALGALGRIAGEDLILDALLDGRRASAVGRDPLAVARAVASDLSDLSDVGVLDAV
ncbi:MAG TPA: hydroxymethylbilane synthase, partial [Candidatus Limnocylindria bacterium]|nr:hydroxymethylbilane synthase [Candidatus Limnocylindria bacterium]